MMNEKLFGKEMEGVNAKKLQPAYSSETLIWISEVEEGCLFEGVTYLRKYGMHQENGCKF